MYVCMYVCIWVDPNCCTNSKHSFIEIFQRNASHHLARRLALPGTVFNIILTLTLPLIVLNQLIRDLFC